MTHHRPERTPSHKHLMRYALAAAARGWHVFPITPSDKVPLADWPWKDRNTTDPDVIRRFWTTTPANIGIACGPSGLVVVDLDIPKPGQHPPPQWDQPGIRDGADVLAALCEQHGQPFPADTFTVRTRRGGTHLYFTAPPGARLGNTSGERGRGLGWCIDTRADGGYVVGPGSHVTRPDGTGTYQVIHRADPVPLPGWLADLLTAPDPEPAPPGGYAPMPPAAEGDRAAAYMRKALADETQRVLSATEPGRNDALNAAAFSLGQLVAAGRLPLALVYDALTMAACQVGLHRDLNCGRRGIDRTIRSGLAAGARKPRGRAA